MSRYKNVSMQLCHERVMLNAYIATYKFLCIHDPGIVNVRPAEQWPVHVVQRNRLFMHVLLREFFVFIGLSIAE